MSAGPRIAVAGGSGSLGREVAAVWGERNLPLGEWIPCASEGSQGEDVELAGEVWPVRAERPALAALDLVVVCTPRDAALAWVRDALRSEVPCVDGSGALAASPEVPLVLSALSGAGAAAGAPAVASPAGAALTWAPPLAAVRDAAGLRRAVGTVLRAAGRAGRAGLEALSEETVALLSQREPPPPAVFPAPVAFDCWPLGEAGRAFEDELPGQLSRLLGAEVGVAADGVQVPAFAGEASSVRVELERDAPVAELEAALAKAPGVELWSGPAPGPGLRDAAGRDAVLVGPPRSQPGLPGWAALWIAGDPLRLAARNLVALAEARLGLA